MRMNPQIADKVPPSGRRRAARVPHRCPGDAPVIGLVPLSSALELIYSTSLGRVAGIIIPQPVSEEIVLRCSCIGGVREWKSWGDLAKRWGVWAVFGEDRWGVSETVLSGTRPNGWKFRFVN